MVQVGACEEVLIDACQSAGSGGRPLQFSFSIASTQLLPPQLLAAFPQPGPQCSVTLARDAMQPGTTYNISVAVVNFLGGQDSAQVRLERDTASSVGRRCMLVHCVPRCGSSAWCMPDDREGCVALGWTCALTMGSKDSACHNLQ